MILFFYSETDVICNQPSLHFELLPDKLEKCSFELDSVVNK